MGFLDKIMNKGTKKIFPGQKFVIDFAFEVGVLNITSLMMYITCLMNEDLWH